MIKGNTYWLNYYITVRNSKALSYTAQFVRERIAIRNLVKSINKN